MCVEIEKTPPSCRAVFKNITICKKHLSNFEASLASPCLCQEYVFKTISLPGRRCLCLEKKPKKGRDRCGFEHRNGERIITFEELEGYSEKAGLECSAWRKEAGPGAEKFESSRSKSLVNPEAVKYRELLERVRTIEEVYSEVSQNALGSEIIEQRKKRVFVEVYDTQYYLESLDENREPWKKKLTKRQKKRLMFDGASGIRSMHSHKDDDADDYFPLSDAVHDLHLSPHAKQTAQNSAKIPTWNGINQPHSTTNVSTQHGEAPNNSVSTHFSHPEPVTYLPGNLNLLEVSELRREKRYIYSHGQDKDADEVSNISLCSPF
jgi:hypothetical protein